MSDITLREVDINNVENNSSMYLDAMNQLKENYEKTEDKILKIKREYKHILKEVINISAYIEKIDTILKSDCDIPELLTLSDFLYNDFQELLEHILFKSSLLVYENIDI